MFLYWFATQQPKQEGELHTYTNTQTRLLCLLPLLLLLLLLFTIQITFGCVFLPGRFFFSNLINFTWIKEIEINSLYIFTLLILILIPI